MAKQMKLSELMVGQELSDFPASKYGQMVNIRVHELKTSKIGRIKMIFLYDYKNAEGVIEKTNLPLAYSNGPLSPETLVTLK